MTALLVVTLLSSVAVAASDLPAHYIQLLSTGVAQVEKRLATGPAADLQSLEFAAGWCISAEKFSTSGNGKMILEPAGDQHDK